MIAVKGKIVAESSVIDGYLVIEDGRISEITQNRPQCETVDLSGRYLVPGFIDMHIHGIHEFLVDDGPEALQSICRTLPRYGVTSFLPTVSPLPQGEDAAYLATLAATPVEGTQILGFHLEGPFLKLTGA
ncbi:MAG: amidohydrolase family protein, partial [Bacteroidales bacterium]|nr:amidohydrolase family protein [Bacteroidales bacterium]